MMPFVIFTVGHGTKSTDEFVGLLKTYEVRRVVDIRTVPRSRHNPQFNKEFLRESLKKARIGYLHMKGLGGLRHSKKDSLNLAWRNASFRGFADYMQTEEFRENIDRLIKLSKQKKIALMCAESLPWRCHRSLVADALHVRGIRVKHIMSSKTSKDHDLTPWAEVRDFQVSYPGTSTETDVRKLK